MRASVAAILALGAFSLAGCAGDPKPADPPWTGGDPAHLVVDSAQCRKEAADLDVNSPSTYSDPRYGVTSAKWPRRWPRIIR